MIGYLEYNNKNYSNVNNKQTLGKINLRQKNIASTGN